MVMTDLSNDVIKVVAEVLGQDESIVVPEASFSKDLGADSIAEMDLIMELESRFRLEIPDDEAQKIKTVGEAIAYIEQRLEQEDA